MEPPPPPSWRIVARRIKRDLQDGRASILAGGVAFYCFLALFPALTALVSLYGLVADPRDVGRQLDTLAPVLPVQLREVMQEELGALAARSSGTLSLELIVGILVALWAANKGTRALLIAVAAVFDPGKAGNIVRLSVVALRLTAAAVAFCVVSLGAIVVLPAVLKRLGVDGRGLLIVWLRWPVLAALLLVGLASIYRSAGAHITRWRWMTPGSALATTLWVLGSAGFSWFVSSHTSHYRVDGSVAAFAILQGWFLLSAYVVLLGATVDAELERTRTQPVRPAPSG